MSCVVDFAWKDAAEIASNTDRHLQQRVKSRRQSTFQFDGSERDAKMPMLDTSLSTAAILSSVDSRLRPTGVPVYSMGGVAMRD